MSRWQTIGRCATRGLRGAVLAVSLMGTSAVCYGMPAPVTSADVGEYAACPWDSKPGTERYQRVHRLNFTVYSVNTFPGGGDTRVQADRIKLLLASKKRNQKFILRLNFWDENERVNKCLEPPVYARRCVEFLQMIPVSKLDGICLSEENVPFQPQVAVLNHLYEKLKKGRKLFVYQWLSPYWTPAACPQLRADGWVLDPYFVDEKKFYEQLNAFEVTKLPLIFVAYTSVVTSEAKPSLVELMDAFCQAEIARKRGHAVMFYWTFAHILHQGTCYFGTVNEPRMQFIDKKIQAFCRDAVR